MEEPEKSDVKKKIREVRAKIGEAIAAHDSAGLKKLRLEVKRLKRRTRRMAARAKSAGAPVKEEKGEAPPG